MNGYFGENIDAKLMRLLSIPSVSHDEKKIAEEITLFLSDTLGFSKIRAEGENNIVCLLNPEKEKSAKKITKIALVGHLDTVPYANDAQKIPFVKNGIVYGRGAVDMKSGLACMLQIADEISQGADSDYAISLVFYSREEKHLPNGLNEVLDSKILKDIDAALVLEPTNSAYALGCLGSITADIIFHGKAAHSSQPESGINAIYNSTDFLVDMKKKSKETRREILDGMECREYINVTGISTDNAHNVIPSSCKVTVNYRFFPLKDNDSALASFRRLIGEDSKTENAVIKIKDVSPSVLVNEENFPVKFLDKNEKKILHAWTDASQLVNSGIVAINYGPGDIKYAHQDDEQISIKALHDFYSDLKQMILK